MASSLLAADARNRALRTFLVGLATDILAAVILLLTPLITAANSWSDLDWKLMGFMLAKTLVATLFSYLLRTVLDKSVIPTPLPPSDPGEPDKNVVADPMMRDEGGYSRDPLHVLIYVLVVFVVVALILWVLRVLLAGA